MTDEHPATRLSWRARLLLGGYPPWWRLRYDDEMRATVLAMQQDGHWRAKDGRDLGRGLVEAWLNPAIVPGEDPESDRTRRQVTRTAWGLLLVVLAGGGFAKITDDPTMTAAVNHHLAIRGTLLAIMVAAALTATMMLIASIPYVAAILRQGRHRARRNLAPLLAIPICAAVYAATAAVAIRATNGADAHSAMQIAAFTVLVVITIGCGLVCTAAVLRVATQTPETPATRRCRVLALAAVAALTILTTLSVVAWVVAVAIESPGLLHAHDGLLATPTLPSLALAVLGLCLAAALCGPGLSSRSGALRRNS